MPAELPLRAKPLKRNQFSAENGSSEQSESRKTALLISAAVFAASMILVVVVIRLLLGASEEASLATQKVQHEDTKLKVNRLLNLPVIGLDALASHIQIQDSENPLSFGKFVNGLGLFDRINGLHAIGLLELPAINQNDLSKIRLSMVEPLVTNQEELGAAFFQTDAIRTAMEKAKQTKNAVFSDIFLLNPSDPRSLGLVYIKAVHREATLSQRKNETPLIGFVYAQVSVRELLSELSKKIHKAQQFNLIQENVRGQQIVFSTQSGNNTVQQASADLDPILGNNLKIEFLDDPISDDSVLIWLPFAVLGTCFSLGLSLIVWLFALRKDQAQWSAEQVNTELALMAKVAKHTSSSVIIINLYFEVVWVNPSFEQTFGFDSNDVIGKPLATFFDTDSTDPTELGKLSDATTTQSSYHTQLQLKSRDGKQLWFDIELQPMHNDKSACVGFMLLGSEITQLRQAQATAIAQRNRWESIARASNLGVMFWDVTKNQFTCNTAFAYMLGFQLTELEHLTVNELKTWTHPNDAVGTHSEIEKILAGKSKHTSGEVRMKHRKGHWVWTSVNVQLQETGPDGTAASLLFVYVDNSVARAREHEWRARADLSADWYWRTDPEHRFVEISVGNSNTDGPEASRLLGKRRDEISHLEKPSIGWEQFHSRMDQGENIHGVQYRDLSNPNRPVWIEIQGKPLWSPNGELLGYSGIGRDVTVNQSATEALRHSLALVDALFEALPLPLVMKDVAGHFVRSNFAYAELFDIPQSDLFNARVSDFMDPEMAQIHNSEDQLVLKDKTRREYELVQTLPNKDPINALIRKAPILDTSGEPVGIVEMIIDVSKQRQAEQAERQAKEQALLASKSKSAFLATMSHEIRTPMNGVLGMAELLSLSGLDADQSDAVKIIRESASNLMTIIDDILDFSKIEAGHLTLESEPIDLLGIVEGVADALQQVAAQKKVHLDVFVDPNIPELVLGDSLRLRQVLNNLVGNALKFTSGLADREGQVYLRVELTGPKELHFMVADNGIGISEESKALLFEAFTQAERTTARRYGGTGLGLVICQRIIGAMGAKIHLESEVGVGSRFSFTLPLTMVGGLFPGIDQSLEGVNCCLLNVNETQALDWSAYLRGAGASIVITRKIDPTDLRDTKQNVIISNDIGPEDDIRKFADQWIKPAPNCSLIIVGQGSRKQARIIKTDVVHFDTVRKSTLLEAVKLATGRTKNGELGTNALVNGLTSTPAPSIEEAEKIGRLILVAEDDPINRKVISQQLSMIGYAAETVEDGVAALDKWRSGRFALLLTDLHMPILDGYDLTRTIRAFEPEFQRIPILALTANAITGEDAKAHDAGIDAYLTKPITLKKLREQLALWLPDRANDDALAEPLQTKTKIIAESSAIPTAPVVFDNGVLKVFVGDDPETIVELLNDYLESIKLTRQQLTDALNQANASEATSIAHRLKSSSRSVGALRLGDWCAQLEQMASETIVAQRLQLIKDLTLQLDQVVQAINDHCASTTI